MESKKKYAIKIMRENQINTPNKLENFVNEVQILSSIRYSNIVQIINCNLNGECKRTDGRITKVAYYVMKFAEYGELFKIIQNTPNFSEKCTRYYFHQLIKSISLLKKHIYFI